MSDKQKLYKSIISPGIVEIRSNVRPMLGGYSLNFDSEQGPESSAMIRITSFVSNHIHRRSIVTDTEFGYVQGDFDKNILYHECTLLNPIKARIELKGLGDNPTITVNNSYYRFVRINLGSIRPFSTCIQDLLSIELLMRDHEAIHGASFGISNEAILIIGLPGIGKSVVLFEALKQGYHFIAEDIIIMDGDGYLYSCPGASSLAYDIDRIQDMRYYGEIKSLRRKWRNFTGKISPIFHRQQPPYIDISSVLPEVQSVTHVEPCSVFILAKGRKRVEKLTRNQALAMLIAINRHTLSYHENRMLLTYSLRNPWLDMTRLMQTEERLLEKLIESSSCFLCVAPDPNDYFDLIQQNI